MNDQQDPTVGHHVCGSLVKPIPGPGRGQEAERRPHSPSAPWQQRRKVRISTSPNDRSMQSESKNGARIWAIHNSE